MAISFLRAFTDQLVQYVNQQNSQACDKKLNIWKSDRTPKECGLKLLSKPTRPRNGMVFSFMRDEWKMFLESGDFSNS